MAIRLLQDVACEGRIVVIRQDLNVPMKDGVITNDKRIRAALPGVRMALEKGAAGVVLLSHLGRPVEGEFDAKFSLAPVAAHLSSLLGRKVRLAATPEEARPAPGEIVLLENVRFFKGEKKNDPALAARFAALGDIYVMDAFGAAHRAHASTEGAVRQAATACAGPLMAAELEAFGRVLHNPARPLAAIIGGSKVSSKLGLLENLVDKVDSLIVGGGIANTFLAASGVSVGASLYEPDLVEEARRIMDKAAAQGKSLPLPVDVVTAAALEPGQKAVTRAVSDVPADEMILDIGPRTVALYEELLGQAATIVWNGPVGAFEVEPFGAGTRALATALAASSAFVVVGGGDSVAAVESYGLADRMGYISTGGGASLELLEGKVLPSVAALEARG
ncbi:phosphoglycerate kinase [uncultured Desulfovibrio sp.]|uniref:phosphoglycerate kinase n=1 Tax=uncultured Desulfovibrio sp. TaxID=167968 RepID=UPI00262A3EC9|nr:phosphoglycerate kinase [uncultured Desulfovibrio sp.]